MANDISKDLQQLCKIMSVLNTNVLGLVRATQHQTEVLDEMAEVLTEVRDILDEFELEEFEENHGAMVMPNIRELAEKNAKIIDYTKYKGEDDFD